MAFQRVTLSYCVLIAISLTTLVNCAGVNFGKSDSASTGADGNAGAGKNDQPVDPGASGSVVQPGAGPGGTDVSNAGGPAGPVTGVGNTAAAILPKLQFIGPPCTRLTNCAITFKLDKAYAAQTEFDWRTDDARFGTAPNPGAPMWGKAGYHYVSTSGHVVFPAGTTEQTVYVRNINPDNVEISIGVVMTECAYSGKYESCAKFFAP